MKPAPSHDGRLVGRLVLICLSVWLHAADTLVTATMAPAVIADLSGVEYINWLVSLYEAGAVISGAAIAAACQRWGLKHAMLYAALAYLGGCVVAALAGSTGAVLWGRLIQGLGGGALLSLSYIATYDWFEERWWNKVFGLVAAIWGIGSLLGPLIGGIFSRQHAWRTAFWIFAGLAAVLCLLILSLLPRQDRPKPAATRWPVLTIAVLSAGTLLIAEAGVASGNLAATLICAAGVALLYLAARIDRRAMVRLLPEEALDVRTPLGAGLMMIFALAVATTGFWSYGPLVLKILFGFDPLLSGYILAVEAIAWSLGTVAVSFRQGAEDRGLIRVGMVLVVLGAAGFTLAVPKGSTAGLILCAAGQGLGFGICWPFVVTRCVQLATAEKAVASAAPATLQRIGYAVGTAFAGVLANWSGLALDLERHGASAVYWVFAGFIPMLAIGLWLTWRFTAIPLK